MFRRYLFAPSGRPCSQPPWGTLAAVDIGNGTIRWQVPLGSMQGFGGATTAVPPGSISLGGPIVTAGGIAFIAGTFDPFLRAFDIENGRELWKGELPAGGHATPMTYKVAGRQYSCDRRRRARENCRRAGRRRARGVRASQLSLRCSKSMRHCGAGFG